jgi:hypothetical protein
MGPSNYCWLYPLQLLAKVTQKHNNGHDYFEIDENIIKKGYCIAHSFAYHYAEPV